NGRSTAASERWTRVGGGSDAVESRGRAGPTAKSYGAAAGVVAKSLENVSGRVIGGGREGDAVRSGGACESLRRRAGSPSGGGGACGRGGSWTPVGWPLLPARRGGNGGSRRPHAWHTASSSAFSALQNGQNLIV